MRAMQEILDTNLPAICVIVALLLLGSQYMSSKTDNIYVDKITNKILPGNSLILKPITLSGWQMSHVQWTQFKSGLNYIFGIKQPALVFTEHNSSKLALAKQQSLMIVNSFVSATFAIFLGLSVVLPPLILMLLFWRPVIAWWLTPTMLLSSLWWLSKESQSGFYIWFLSVLSLSMLVILTLIKQQYFRSALNAFAGVKSLPFHLPVVYMLALIIIAAIKA